MTDAEIMKGVKLCNGDLGNCKECPFDSIGKTCGIELAKAEIGLIERLQAENAALRERLEKAVELPAIAMIERTLVDGKFKPTQKAQAFNGRIGVVYRDETRGYKGLLVDICSEKVSDYEAAEERLKQMQGGEG